LLLSLLFWRRGTMWKWSDDMSTGSKDFHQCIHHEMYLWCYWCKERGVKEYVIFVSCETGAYR
jgi:hypothetical protein